MFPGIVAVILFGAGWSGSTLSRCAWDAPSSGALCLGAGLLSTLLVSMFPGIVAVILFGAGWSVAMSFFRGVPDAGVFTRFSLLLLHAFPSLLAWGKYWGGRAVVDGFGEFSMVWVDESVVVVVGEFMSILSFLNLSSRSKTDDDLTSLGAFGEIDLGGM